MNLDRYHELKGQMKTGDLILWHTDSILGSAIQHFTKSNVNHAAMVITFQEYEGAAQRRFIIEALDKVGSVLNLLSRRLEAHKGRAWWYALNDDWNDSLRYAAGMRALDLVGRKYDYISLIENAWKHVEADDTALFCSELWFLALGFHGIAPRPNELPTMGITKEGVEL
jgi:hypothetical protein